MNLLNDKVLVLNRLWQAIDETDVQTAICDIVRGASCVIYMDEKPFQAMNWEEWTALPIRECDRAILSVRGPVRIPTVIGKFSYARMPKRTIKFGNRGVRQRDKAICQVTGKHAPNGNVDHWVSREKGGPNTWENTVWMDREINTLKRNMSPEEFTKKFGYRLLKKPKAPEPVPACALIPCRKPDWAHFVGGN